MRNNSWTGIVRSSYGDADRRSCCRPFPSGAPRTRRTRGLIHVTLMPPDALADRLKSGLLSFPVTHFDADLRVDEKRYREHLAWQASFDVAGLFAAGGTGEGFSLTSDEIDRVLRIAVEEAGDRVPVLAPATGSTAQAVAQAQAAEAAGASGLLLFPPYLTEASQAGLVEHIGAPPASASSSTAAPTPCSPTARSPRWPTATPR
jgi:Dihydrodipicolinate synthetase family